MRATTVVMVSILRVLSFLCFLVILTISKAIAQPGFLNYSCINDNTADIIYKTNLDALLSGLTSKEIDYGFYNFSYGENSDKVNAIGMCRGDVKPDDCRSCLKDSSILLPQLCSNQTEAIGWYDTCMLRYSNRSIFGLMETSPSFSMKNVYDAPAVYQFNRLLINFLENLTDAAGAGDLRRKFAAGNVPGPEYQTIYALVQCTPDLSEQACKTCLTEAISRIPQSCSGKIGCRVDGPSCSFRYETVRFYDPLADTPPAPPPSNDKTFTQEKKNTLKVIAIVVPVVAVAIVFIIVDIYLRVTRPWQGNQGVMRPGEGNQRENSSGISGNDNIQLVNGSRL